MKLQKLKDNCDRAQTDADSVRIKGWKDIDPQDVVCSDSNLLEPALRKLKWEDDTLWIRGHCEAGPSQLDSSNDPSEEIISISVENLVELLKGKLNPKFPGKIKIFGCESSKDTSDSRSFAKQFAFALSEACWINCRFYGFNEIVLNWVHQISRQRLTKDRRPASSARELIQVPTKHTRRPM